MNTSWMMIGDWGTMPMNRRGRKGLDNATFEYRTGMKFIWDNLHRVEGKHYDMIVMDDMEPAPLCWNCATNKGDPVVGGQVCMTCWRGGCSPVPNDPLAQPPKHRTATEEMARAMLADLGVSDKAIRGFDKALAKVRNRPG